MSYTKKALVNHRVGGLEGFMRDGDDNPIVNHRVGGLEVSGEGQRMCTIVNHRVGGLEVSEAKGGQK